MIVAVYDRDEDFPKANRQVYLGKVDVVADPMLVVIEGIAPGTYACAVIDDVDGNGTLNTNLVGYPTEPFGFSNDARVKLFGPPDFGDAKFEFREPETSIDVTLR